MKSTGRRSVKFYDESHAVRQQPLPGRTGNDSTWLQWRDDENKVGGARRIGHEYNLQGAGPMVAAWTHPITPKGVFERVRRLPLREEDKLPRGRRSGGDGLYRHVQIL